MREYAASVLQKIVKYMILAGVIASFFFIGWRIATKGEYERRELAQCEALAVSAALASCGALDEGTLASYIREHGTTTFVIDHRKMPGHNVVSVSLEPRGDGFFVLARAETNWNSRSPQWAEVSALKDKNGISLAEESAIAKTLLRLANYEESSTATRLTFTFPYERECPVPFDVIAIKTNGLYKVPLTLLMLAKEQ